MCWSCVIDKGPADRARLGHHRAVGRPGHLDMNPPPRRGRRSWRPYAHQLRWAETPRCGNSILSSPDRRRPSPSGWSMTIAGVCGGHVQGSSLPPAMAAVDRSGSALVHTPEGIRTIPDRDQGRPRAADAPLLAGDRKSAGASSVRQTTRCLRGLSARWPAGWLTSDP